MAQPAGPPEQPHDEGGVSSTRHPVRARRGLSSEQARQRLAEVGPNALPPPKPMPLWRRVLRQLRSALIYVLLFALIAI